MVDPPTVVLTCTRGGLIRFQILGAPEVEPRTDEGLATTLGSDPSTLREHLVVLEANNMVDASKRTDTTEYVLADEAPPLPK